MSATALAERNTALLRRGVRLEQATLGWNVLELGFTAWAAIAARSIALAGFGLDTMIEIFASIVVLGELQGTSTPASERRAVRRIGVAFFALAFYLMAQAVISIASDTRPHRSLFGIAILAATAFAMFSLAWAKHRTGTVLQHRVLLTEAKVTVVDGALATGILIGLVLNASFGWWWADVASGFVVVIYGLRQGVEAFRDEPDG